jgi:hypothetical protein
LLPLWIMADEDPSAHFSVHARVLIGLHGDGAPDGTIATSLDTIPNPPSPSTETVETLQRASSPSSPSATPQAAEPSGRR